MLQNLSVKWPNSQIPEHTICPEGCVSLLTHWAYWVTHICVSKLTIIGSDNGLSPGRRQAIIWTNAGILLIVNIFIHENAFESVFCEMASIVSASMC